MTNPILDTLRRYEHIPVSSVTVTLMAGEIRMETQRYGMTIARPACEFPSVTVTELEAYPPLIDNFAGEWHRTDVARYVKAAARITNALDYLEVQDGAETRWHFRPCNSRHWTIHKMGRRSFRMPIKTRIGEAGK